MKKLMTIMVLLVSLVLVACKPSEEEPTVVPDVVSIEFSMASTTLAPGEHTLVAYALPQGANQQIRFTIQGIVSGVSITGDKLNIGNAVEDGTKFTIVATSIYDPTIRKTIEITVVNAGVDVIEISTEAELRAINTTQGGLGKSYKLMNNIALTQPWTPIGVAEVELESGQIVPGTPFSGIFDGQGYTISGIVVESDQPLFVAGFFAQIGPTAIVKNTGFEGRVTANGWSGGIAGINEGVIENVISNVRVTVFGTSAGSIVSVNRGIIQYAYGIGKVVSETNPNTSGRSAGLVVANDGSMVEVYGDYQTLETPNYAAFSPTTNPNYMLSTVDMKTASTWSAFNTAIWYIADGTYPLLKHEGFVPPVIVPELGLTIKNTNLNIDVEVANTLQITAEIINPAGGETLVYALKQAVTGVTIDQTGLVTFDINTIAANFTFIVEVSIQGTEIKAEKSFTGVYNPEIVDDTVYIETETQLINLLAGQIDPINLSKTFILVNDIILTTPWTTIGIAPNEDEGILGVPFTGVFDGQGYKISGIDMSGGGWNKAFFAYIGTTGVVKNTHFKGFVEANAWSAGLVAANHGLVQDVIIDIEVYVWGSHGGAIAVHNHGTLKNIIVLGKVVSDNGPTAVGLVATNVGTMQDIYANADKVGTPNVKSFGQVADNGTYIISATNFVLAATYQAFDTAIWYIADGTHPLLKHEGFVPPVIEEPSHIVYITTEAQLRDLVNNQTEESMSKTYILMNDITLTEETLESGMYWTKPIGTDALRFNGIFDGNGFTIYNVRNAYNTIANFGFFGYIGTAGVVQNLILDTNGILYVGTNSAVFVQYNFGTIQNVMTFGEIRSTTVSRYTTGFIRQNNGIIKNAIANVIISHNEGSNVRGAFAVSTSGTGTFENALYNAEIAGSSDMVGLSTGLVKFYPSGSNNNFTNNYNTEYFKTAANFSGWDASIWLIVDGQYITLQKNITA